MAHSTTALLIAWLGPRQGRGISEQHVCILVTRDRSGQTCDFVTGRGQVTAAQLKQHLRPVLGSDTLLVSDANKAYQAFARKPASPMRRST